MGDQSLSPIPDPFETEAEIILLQEQVGDAQDEANRVKQQLRDKEAELKRKEDELKRARASKNYCIYEAAKSKQEYAFRLDQNTKESCTAQDRHFDQLAGKVSQIAQLRSKLQATEAQKAKHEENEKFLEGKINSSNHMIKVLKLQLQTALSPTSSDGQATRRKRTLNESTWYVVLNLITIHRTLTIAISGSRRQRAPPTNDRVKRSRSKAPQVAAAGSQMQNHASRHPRMRTIGR